MQLHVQRVLHLQQTDTDQDLFVKVCLHVGQLLLFDRAALQNTFFVILLHTVQTIEQCDEFGLLVAGQAGSIELEIPFFGFAHAADQFEYRFLFVWCRCHGEKIRS